MHVRTYPGGLGSLSLDFQMRVHITIFDVNDSRVARHMCSI